MHSKDLLQFIEEVQGNASQLGVTPDSKPKGKKKESCDDDEYEMDEKGNKVKKKKPMKKK